MPESRLDTDALYAALNSKRRSEGLSWRQLAKEVNISPSTLTRLGQGKRPDVDGFAVLVEWLGVSADEFLVPGPGGKPEEQPNTLAVISTHLRSSKELSEESAKYLDEIIRAAYEGLKEK